MSFNNLMWHVGRKTAALFPSRYLVVSGTFWAAGFLVALLADIPLERAALVGLVLSFPVGVLTALVCLANTWHMERNDGSIKPPLMTALTAKTAGLAALMVGLHYLAAGSVWGHMTVDHPRRFWAALASLALVWLLAKLRIWQIRRGH